eukprot:TRINITY_DN49882_c0_g1_i1.p1 TRINITY_DN49882_c0_g1~~TRINITY_DN49882_c0_g1_i1.p1  ORF type:complete len:562 (-),score=68.31 TRINITY_DN49882_c0_g1_i1:63-1748(-)
MAWALALMVLPSLGSCTLFSNPVIDQNAPDPGVAKFGDTWYMATTGGSPMDGAFTIRASSDLVEWKQMGQVFPRGAVPAWSGSDYWAPELHQVGKKYHVYFSARESTACYGVAGNLIGADVSVTSYEGTTEDEKDASCCAKCNAEPSCTFWVRRVSERQCWLKKQFERLDTSDKTVRGNLKAAIRRLGVGVATADSPLGPYIDIGAPLVISGGWMSGGFGDDGMDIDAHFFKDTSTGRQYLLWKRNQIPSKGVPATINIRELSSCGTAWAVGSSEIALLKPEQPWEGNCVEAPWLVQRGGEYFLFYSAETTFGSKYAVGVARAASVTGPYSKACAPVISQFATDLSASVRKFASPGHCSVVATDQGFAMVYHAYHMDAVGGKRVTLVDRLVWGADGWPQAGTCGTPTSAPQPYLEETAAGLLCLQIGEVYRFGLNVDNVPMTTDGVSDFYVRSGNCPGGSISLEAVETPGHFVRHMNGTLQVDKANQNATFAKDSSFMAPPGLARNDPATVSLRSVNYPYSFVLRKDGIAEIAPFNDSNGYATNATWALAQPLLSPRVVLV